MGLSQTRSATSVKPGFHPVWWLAIGGVVLIVVSMGVAWQSIPNPMAVQWSTRDNQHDAKLGWVALWAGAWALVSSRLVAMRAPFDWRRGLLIVVLGILVAGYLTTLFSNLEARTWREADPLSLPLAAVLAVIAAGAIWLLDRLLDRRSLA